MSAEWFQVYEARFGKRLTDAEVQVWEDEIALQVRRLLPGDVINAVRGVAETRRKKGATAARYAPTAQDIITEIIKGKYTAINPTAGEPCHTVLVPDTQYGDGHYRYEHEPESSWKSRLHRADDPLEAGNIICEPCTPEQCREREEYARQHGIKWQRYSRQANAAVDGYVRAAR